MSSDQAQFLRYYLPGSLFLIYLGLLLAPFTGIHPTSFIVSDLTTLASLLALVGGVFVVSPAVGYVLYSVYDTFRYNHFAMNWEKRRSLSLLIEWATQGIPNLRQIHDIAKNPTPERLKLMEENLGKVIRLKELQSPIKSLVDFIIHSGPRRNALEVKGEQVSVTIRAEWSHFAARRVCGILVPFFAFVVAFLFILFPYYLWFMGTVFPPLNTLPSARGIWFIIDFLIIIISSVVIAFPWHINKPRYEAFKLEYFVIDSMITTHRGEGNPYGDAKQYFRSRIRDARIQTRRRRRRKGNRT